MAPQREQSTRSRSTNRSKSSSLSVLSVARSWFKQTRGYTLPRRRVSEEPRETAGPPSQPLSFRRRVGYTIKSVDTVRREELTNEDIIVAVMGPTGAGKSTFIQTVTGRENGVGHTLQSYTSEVNVVRVTFTDGINVVLVDTPGFDDTYLSDLDILKKIAKWLRDVHRSGLKLSGILYLHRITDNRMAGTPLKNFTMFKKLCGEDFFEKVILTTTMWPDAGNGDEEDICVQREEELSRNYWAEMISRGSHTRRFRNTQASAWDILDYLVSAEYRRRLVRIQEELVDEGKSLPGTEAGQQLHGLFGELIERQNDLLKRMKEELAKTGDSEIMVMLLNELSELRKEREKAMKDMRQLDSSLLGRVHRSFSVKNHIALRIAKRKAQPPEHHQTQVLGYQQQAYEHAEQLETSHIEAVTGSSVGPAPSPEDWEWDRLRDIGPMPQNGLVEQPSNPLGKTGDLEEDYVMLEETSSEVRGARIQDLVSRIVVDDRQKAATIALLGEDAQCIVDVISAILRETNNLTAEEQKRALSLLCKLARTASVFPRFYELQGVQYDASKPLDREGLTDIYKGEYENQQVCLKMVRVYQSWERRSEMVTAHAGGVVLWAHLSHEHILPFYGVYFEQQLQRICLISPWMENGSLRNYLEKHSKSPRMPLISDIINGLCYLHDLGIVHGDLKAQNILVSANERALIGYFPVSRVEMNAEAYIGPLMETVRWNAPEIFTGDGDGYAPPTPESDIWSLGCVCYEVFTLREPFHQYRQGPQVISALIGGTEVPMRPGSDDRDHIDNRMWDIMMSCWKYTPEQRPTCKELQRLFQNLGLQDDRSQISVRAKDSHTFWKTVAAKSVKEIDYQRAYRILTHIQQNVDRQEYGLAS